MTNNIPKVLSSETHKMFQPKVSGKIANKYTCTSGTASVFCVVFCDFKNKLIILPTCPIREGLTLGHINNRCLVTFVTQEFCDSQHTPLANVILVMRT